MSGSNEKQPKKKLALVRENVKRLAVRTGIQTGTSTEVIIGEIGRVTTKSTSGPPTRVPSGDLGGLGNININIRGH